MIEKTTNNRADMHEKIVKALAAKNMLRKPPTLSEINNFLNVNPHIKKLTKTRNIPNASKKLQIIEKTKSKGAYDTALNFIQNYGNIYVTFGGVGDLVLLLGQCCNDPDASIVFFANTCSLKFGEEFLKHFAKNYCIVPNLMGSKWASLFIEEVKNSNKLMPSGHLPEGLNYEDWRKNTSNYEKKIINKTNWVEEFGFAKYDVPTVLIAPTGSQRDAGRQRYMLPDEYLAIVHLCIKKGMIVFSVGSESDFARYPSIENKNHFWLTSNKLFDYKKGIKEHNFKDFLRIINSANEVISMDTWLKTYTCLAGIKTHVILNRRPEKYIEYGTDVSDYIFLNKNIWKSMELWRVDDLVEYFRR
jgi:hypothetical protein